MTVQYLIDSENVGDFWIPLLELPGQDTELIVFYTRNSPHMSYDSLIRLKESDRTVTFIKCYEGTNALDFQLVSELGYRISKDEEGSFIIVTNDTGFDAAVKYWRRRKKSVKRITGKECKNLERRLREDLSVGSSQTRSAHVSGRLFTEPENDAVPEVQEEVIREKAVQDNDARPSRPNLRDAERAAQPDPDESDLTENSGYMEEADIDDTEGDDADSFAYDRDADDAEETAYDMEEDDLQDNDAYDIDTEEPADDAEDFSGSEDVFDADEDSDSFEDYAAAVSKSLEDAQEEDLAFSDVQDEAADDTESVMNSDEEPSAQDLAPDNAAKASEKIEETQMQAAEEAAAQEEVQDLSVQDDEVTSDAFEDLKDAAADAAETSFSQGAEAPEEAGEADLQEEHAEADEATAEAETAAAEEESAGAAHRSKSRRSRSRRSRSTARKQEQAAAPQGLEESADAADSAKTPEALDISKPADAAVNDGRKNDKERDDSGAAADGASDALPAPGDEEIARIVACIGAENLAELHNQLATFYGDQGKDIYLSIKNNTRTLPVLKPDLKQKFAYYCEIIFNRSDYAGEYPSDISEYLLNVREKLNNLNSLRYALQKHYGKEKGRRFYFLLKPFAKTMYQM